MAINPHLELKQGQTLTMTTQLQQAIKLLQLSNIELAEFVEAELERNPFLERNDDEYSSSEGNSDMPANDENSEVPQEERKADQDEDRFNTRDERPLDTGESLEEGGYDYTSSAYAGTGAGGNARFDDPDYNFENTLTERKSLRDHLMSQIQLEFLDKTENAIASLMVDYLTEAGYFSASTDDIANRLGCDVKRIDEILERLQQLQPSGIFARNLAECLALQLKDKNRFDPAMEKLVANLEMLAKRDMKKLKEICGVNDEDLVEMIDEIKHLNPKPAAEFDHFIAQTVIPDIFMRPLPKTKGGGWAIELNSDTLPKVLLNKTYYKEIVKGSRNKEEKEYLNEQMNTANWLIKAMDQRAQTILNVATEIIQQQENFFNYGVEYLKPLVLKTVAEQLGVHESTVSRVTSNKYMGTPRGVFELKYFFNSGVSNIEGSTEFASEAIKARIKTLIDAENTKKILSDDDIVTELGNEGIAIARRTVAKYREAMKIPSSVQRRREKNA